MKQRIELYALALFGGLAGEAVFHGLKRLFFYAQRAHWFR